MYADFEPLLDDDRVARIAELLYLAFPVLRTYDTEVFTFVVPPQVTVHEGREITIPEQAVFALESKKHPRASFDAFYRGKTLLSTSGVLRARWDQVEKDSKHYVSPREDAAWAPFYINAQEHVRKIKDYKELI